jgi:NAD(P)-dependent dehydrogenase (short-subunit alcohol dehydrogenase family)
MKIEGSTALVTGANRGIGKALAEGLLERGAAKVYAGVRDVATVTDERLVPVRLDVTDAARVREVAAELTDVDLLVNNAGIGAAAPPLSSSLDVARDQLEVNYLGTAATTQAFAPVLARNGGGAVVNVLSVVSFVSMPMLATYSASKAAAWAFTNAARIELKGQGTEVVGVHVGFVDTDMVAGLEVDKVPPGAVVRATLDGLEAGVPEVLVDDLSRDVKAALHEDQLLLYPGLEAEFAQLVGSGAAA